MTQAQPIRRSSRDPEVLRSVLRSWLASRLGVAADVTDVAGTDANGMSSDTVLFRATWPDAGGVTHDDALVARVAPHPADVPVFPSYDISGQFEAMRLVATLSTAPVPEVLWCEPNAALLGAPFFVMRRVDGLVPPDVLPYNFGGNWLYDATPADQQRLQESTIAAIAALHGIDDAGRRFEFLDRPDAGDTHLRRHVAHTRAWYEMVAADGCPSPLVEQGFSWLERRWPAYESEPVLSWGDARIGNVIYADFTPLALLDWEMSVVGLLEIDVTW